MVFLLQILMRTGGVTGNNISSQTRELYVHCELRGCSDENGVGKESKAPWVYPMAVNFKNFQVFRSSFRIPSRVFLSIEWDGVAHYNIMGFTKKKTQELRTTKRSKMLAGVFGHPSD